jgi:hypothetical protein
MNHAAFHMNVKIIFGYRVIILQIDVYVYLINILMDQYVVINYI